MKFKRKGGKPRKRVKEVSLNGYLYELQTLFQSSVMLTQERRMLMNASNKVLMLILVTLGIIALVGCGVSKEDYEKAVSELNKTKAELAQLKSQAGKPSPAEKPAVAEKPGTVDTGTQDKLAASQKETTECRAKVDSLTKENSSLKAMLDKLKAEYAELQKKLGGATQQLPSGLPKKP